MKNDYPNLMCFGNEPHKCDCQDSCPNYVECEKRYHEVFFSFMNGGNKEEEDVCPICGAYIEAHDGEENGYGELHLYWKCDVCKTSGKAVVDLHDDNAFIEHIITDIKE